MFIQYGSLEDAQFRRPLPAVNMSRPLNFFGRDVLTIYRSAVPYEKPAHGTDLSEVYPYWNGSRRLQGL